MAAVETRSFRVRSGGAARRVGLDGREPLSERLCQRKNYCGFHEFRRRTDNLQPHILILFWYDFNWQLGYELAEPIAIPKGTKIVAYAHYDNSENNKYNPDPNRTVYYGNQSWEEMMQPWFAVIVDKKVDVRKLLRRAGPVVTGARLTTSPLDSIAKKIVR